jgi:hypothetical protein
MIELLFLLSGYLQQRFLLESFSNNDLLDMYSRVIFGVLITSIIALTFGSGLIQTLIVIQGIGMLYRVHEILIKIEKENE